jgi:type VI secretion system protein VasD
MSIVGSMGWPAHRRRARAASMAGAAVLVAACASGPKPTEFTATVQASANVNPSVSKRPSPVLVRVYELKAATAFNNADFVSLYQGDQAVLGAEMVGRDEFILNPGDTKPLTKVAAPDTRFIGVFAAYRDLERAKWRSVVPLQLGQKQRIVISAEELSITAVVAK